MSKGNSNFQLSAPGAANQYQSAEVNSGQGSSVNSVGSFFAHPLVAQSQAAGQTRFLTAKEHAPSFSSSLGEKCAHTSATHSGAAHSSSSQSAIQSNSSDCESVVEPLPLTGEPVGTVDEAFALLSAYLDDEVTAAERCLVQHWIMSDPEIRSHYQKQLRLRQAFKSFMGDM